MVQVVCIFIMVLETMGCPYLFPVLPSKPTSLALGALGAARTVASFSNERRPSEKTSPRTHNKKKGGFLLGGFLGPSKGMKGTSK